jgi:chromosome segregation ATPase
MKTKIVLWGNDKDDKRVLVTLELLSTENKVDLKTIPESDATDELYTALMDKWREGETVEFPASTTSLIQELTIVDSLLPEDLKVEKTDIITKAQAEWQFIVLSEKLYASYLSEIDALKEKIAGTSSFDKNQWEELKGLQAKVQNQFKERNIQRTHIGELRNRINELFEMMKQLRAAKDAEFQEVSDKNYEKLTAALGSIENKMTENVRFSIVFDDLKALQRDLKTAKLVREQRNELWERVDNAFKAAKEKRFGPQEKENTTSNANSALGRVQKRYDGLMSALERMQKSIDRDKGELNEQLDKIKNSSFDGILEQQISKAKVNMIENRVTSKEDKLNEMQATRTELEKKIADIKEKEEKRAEREAKDAAVLAAKAVEKTEEKVEVVAEEKSMTSKIADAAKSAIGKAKAVADVIEDKIDEIEDKVEAIADKIEDAVEEKYEAVKEVAEEKFEAAKEVMEEKVEELKDKAEEMVDKAKAMLADDKEVDKKED